MEVRCSGWDWFAIESVSSRMVAAKHYLRFDKKPIETILLFLKKWFFKAHPNTKLFITNGGRLSVQEAIWHGVSMLGIPLHSDQQQNILKVARYGMGERLDVNNITTESFVEQVRTIIESPRWIWGLFRGVIVSPIKKCNFQICWTDQDQIEIISKSTITSSWPSCILDWKCNFQSRNKAFIADKLWIELFPDLYAWCCWIRFVHLFGIFICDETTHSFWQ